MAQDREVKVGDRVKDRLSEVEGIVWGITEYLAGCRRIHIIQKGLKPDGTGHETFAVDEGLVDILERGVIAADKPRIKKETAPTGGPSYLDPTKPSVRHK